MLTTQHNQTKKRAENNILYLVSWAFAAPAFKLMKMFSWFAGAFSICICFLKLQRVELSLRKKKTFTKNKYNKAEMHKIVYIL